MNIKTTMLACIAVGLGATMATAATPSIFTSNFTHKSYFSRLSDNGRYAVFTNVEEENTLFDDYPVFVDLQSGKAIDMVDGKSNYIGAGVYDVSNDGMAVGDYGTEIAQPATWTEAEGWKLLPLPKVMGFQTEGGLVRSVTPDGKWAVGYVFFNGAFSETPALWDLEKNEVVACEGLPTHDLEGSASTQIRFTSISADGKKIIGILNYSYPNEMITFLYDVDKKDYVALGFSKEGTGADTKYTPVIKNLHHVDEAEMSNNGRYIGLNAYIVGEEMGDEYQTIALYDSLTGEYTTYTDSEVLDGKVGAISNEGVMFMNTPASSPIRSWYVRSGKYWVPFEKILRQVYNTTIEGLTKYSDVTTGSVLSLDDSGKIIGSMIMAQTGESYVVTLDEKPEVLGENIDLLSDYTITPAPGSSFSSIRDITVLFDRALEAPGGNNAVSITDEEGNVVKTSIKCAPSVSNPSQLDISFRSVTLEDGKTYTVTIPAGALQIAGDATKPNKEISFSYFGRANGPVHPVSFSPENGAPISLFNMTSNPVLVTFDTNIKLTSEASGAVYELDQEGNVKNELAPLYFSYSGKMLQVFPMNQINFYKGSNYRLVINAGTVTDIIGENPNEEFSIEYEGRYETPQDNDEGYILTEHFNDGTWLNKWMFYEGDHNQPSQLAISLGFLNADEYPAWIVRDDANSEDWSLAMHSMYDPAGQSDDWFISRQLNIPGNDYVLSFKAQGYLNSKQDVLKVVVLESDVIYNVASDELMLDLKTKGKVVHEKIASPGKDEEVLTGDWTEVAIPLAEFDGKNVYIAFVNQNNDQSFFFIDDVMVGHDIDFTLSANVPTQVVAKESISVQGVLKVESAEGQFDALTFKLYDTDGNLVDTKEYTGLDLKHGDALSYSFDKEVPLKTGCTNTIRVQAVAQESSASISPKIDNLMFKPTKRVVIEEGTGQGCSNCPMGHMMLERFNETYGDLVIPVAIHTYTGDNMASGLDAYTQFLGINAYPSAAIDRATINGNSIFFPMQTQNGQLEYISSNESMLWWDVVGTRFNTGAKADINFANYDHSVLAPTYDENFGKLYVPVDVRFALDAEKQNYYLFTVVTEDGLAGVQSNNLYNSTDPLAGEWGKNGQYARPSVKYVFDHVARAAYGESWNGTAGYIPFTVKGGVHYSNSLYLDVPETVENIDNCHIVVMLIDGNTGVVENSVSAKIERGTGVESIEGVEAAASVSVNGSEIVVALGGDFSVEVFSLDGKLVAQAQGRDQLALSANVSGVAVVRVIGEGSVTMEKVMLP